MQDTILLYFCNRIIVSLTMRIDQYLWCLRYYKSRNQASLACKQGHVRIGDRLVKPSREVLIGDKIKVRKNQIWHELMVMDIPKRDWERNWSTFIDKTLRPKMPLIMPIFNPSPKARKEKGEEEGRPKKTAGKWMTILKIDDSDKNDQQ